MNIVHTRACDANQLTPHTVMRWRHPEDVGGTGGTVPFRHVPALIEAARGQGIELSADAFLPTSPAGRAA
jgi:hypothetical protein